MGRAVGYLVTDVYRHVLLEHRKPFLYTFLWLTLVMLVRVVRKDWPILFAHQQPITLTLQVSALAAPFVMALALPMAVLFASLYTCMRIAANPGTKFAGPHGFAPTQVIAPVVAAAVGLALVLLLWVDQVLPRSNGSLQRLENSIHGRGASAPPTERTMTIAELRRAASMARTEADHAVDDSAHGPATAARRLAIEYELEIEKKYSLAGGCVVLAFFGASVGCWLKRGPVAAAVVGLPVFYSWYGCLIAGEWLGYHGIVTPIVAMWTANVVLLIGGLLANWRLSRRPRPA